MRCRGHLAIFRLDLGLFRGNLVAWCCLFRFLLLVTTLLCSFGVSTIASLIQQVADLPACVFCSARLVEAKVDLEDIEGSLVRLSHEQVVEKELEKFSTLTCVRSTLKCELEEGKEDER